MGSTLPGCRRASSSVRGSIPSPGRSTPSPTQSGTRPGKRRCGRRSPQLQAALHGGVRRIVVVVPTTAMSGGSHYVHTAAAAEAIRVLVKSAARQWGERGVTVNAVAVAARRIPRRSRRRGPGVARSRRTRPRRCECADRVPLQRGRPATSPARRSWSTGGCGCERPPRGQGCRSSPVQARGLARASLVGWRPKARTWWSRPTSPPLVTPVRSNRSRRWRRRCASRPMSPIGRSVDACVAADRRSLRWPARDGAQRVHRRHTPPAGGCDIDQALGRDVPHGGVGVVATARRLRTRTSSQPAATVG